MTVRKDGNPVLDIAMTETDEEKQKRRTRSIKN